MSDRRARSARRPDSPRSQHFLRGVVAADVIRDACIRPDDLVYDLGAGSGRLTARLARAARRVVAVELDPLWADRLHGRWENVEVVCGDAASVELPREAFRVVANLPFDSTTAILRHLLDDPHVPLVRADLIVEWGVAVKRGLPWPSTVNDVLWGAWYTTRIERRLPRRSFEPPPTVDAGLLVIERRGQPLVRDESWRRYRQFVANAFRRGGVTRAQPRELDAHEWAAMFAAASSSRNRRRRPPPASRPRSG